MTQILGKLSKFFCFILVLAVATGCTKPEQKQEKQAQGEDDKRTEITFWSVDWGGKVSAKIKKIVEEYNSKHDTVKIKVQFQPYNSGVTGFDGKLLPAIVAGTAPDIVTLYVPFEGIEREMTEYIDDYLIDDENFVWDDIYPFMQNQVLFRGRKTAAPFIANIIGVLMYNKTAYKKAGLDPNTTPKTLDELDAMAEKLTIRDDQGNYEQFGFMPWDGLMAEQVISLAAIFGAKLVDENGDISPLDPRLIKGFEWVMSYAKKYGYEKVNKTIPYVNAFTAGKVAMSYAFDGQIFYQNDQKVTYEWGLAPFPCSEEGIDPTWVGGWNIAVTKGSKNIKEACNFIKYICGRPGQMILLEDSQQGYHPGFSPIMQVNEKYVDAMPWPQQFLVRSALPYIPADAPQHIRDEYEQAYKQAFKDIVTEKAEIRTVLEGLERKFKLEKEQNN